MSIRLRPSTRKETFEFIDTTHRHHRPPSGYRFAIKAVDELEAIRGVVVVGRPVSRNVDQWNTAEVTRLCTDGTQNLCSKLYGAAARTCREMGFDKVITYILESESGISLKASGWTMEETTAGGSWDSPSRPRVDKHPTCKKVRWSKAL
jgi:hypothetical protein